LAVRFPQPDLSALTVDSVTLVVQVNGKIRGRLDMPAGAAEADVKREALALPAVAQQLAGNAPRKVIVIPDKLVNIVA
jgi:leucyl-tRNA synthetase